MKKNLVTSLIAFFAFLSFLAIVKPVDAQAQIAVPKGWESFDSVRFGLFGIHTIAEFYFGVVNDILLQSNKLA